ncbi:hypothetical protein R3P38DRAFT_3229572 [Favolaschia claudopus]|uniref:Uncharacterized protein n=1 Tax=Favolaschia claudopus TaxID=2862362 RepID=A0AAV9ZPD2_9AGAR
MLKRVLIVNMRFMLDGELQTQQDAGAGVDFAVQNAVVFSTSSCFFENNETARYDMAVRNTAKVRSVYIETEMRESSSHIGITETDFFSPDPNAPVNAAHTIWTLNVAASGFNQYVGAEIDGVKYTVELLRNLVALPSRTS